MKYLKSVLVTTHILLAVFIAGCSSNRSSLNKRSGNNYTYTVVRGDSLGIISKKTGVSVNELSRLNGIKNQNHIQPGQKLRIEKRRGNDVAVASYQNVSRVEKTKSVASRPSNPKITNSEPKYTTESKVASVSQIKWKKPTQGSVVRTYNPNLPGHKGVQYTGTVGQNISAAAEGRVVHAGTAPGGYGQLVILKHSNTVYSTYGYLSEVLVKEGANVSLGESIAKMGYSSDKRPVLNFEIRVNNKTTNPVLYVQ